MAAPPPAQRVDRVRALRHAAKAIGARKLLKATTRRLGFDIVRSDYYSPIPHTGSLPEALWTRPRSLGGVSWDEEAQLRYLEQHLAGYVSEFSPPPGFRFDNGLYGAIDTELLHAMVRHLKPKRLVELGSGVTSVIMGAACERNRAEGHPVRYRAFDPYPQSTMVEATRRATELVLQRAEDIALDVFQELGAGDILFVDTTHTVKTGNDVLRIVLDVLPALAPGVVVHFHDILLPWEYPRQWLEEEEWYWAEQYLLQAFLAFNERFEVLVGAYALSRSFGHVVAQLFPSFPPAIGGPGAFWLVRAH